MAEITAGMFTDLHRELGHMSQIDGLAVMAGLDMYGQEFEVKAEELAEYVANTQRVLNSTKDSKGKVVGLPIDCGNHDHEGGAGFIVALEADEQRGVIVFTVEWSEDGLELVGTNKVRYFSASFDTQNKLILGGSLTNWPGSRKPNGAYLLRPVELSRSMKFLQKEKDMTVETQVQEQKPSWLPDLLKELGVTIKTALTPQPPTGPQRPEPSNESVTESVTELMNNTDLVHEVARRAEALAAEKNAIYERQQHVTQLAANIVGGTPSRPLGLAGIRADDIVELLMGLPMKQSLAVEKIICQLTDAMTVNFQELGSGGAGFTRRPRIAPEFRPALQIWVNEGKSLSAWFTQVMPELGKAEDYNLTEFVKEA
jgi:hypothetical protein